MKYKCQCQLNDNGIDAIDVTVGEYFRTLMELKKLRRQPCRLTKVKINVFQ
jgi:hypothetical protein